MKILVSIVNYGTKNIEYAKRLIKEYRDMPFDVDIYILSESPKDYGEDINVLVGLPTKEPWSLPFVHKKLFHQNINRYDLFIYTEDDMLIKKENILAYLSASKKLGGNLIPGFVQYELYPDGTKNYPQVHGPYHWKPDSVQKIEEYIVAEFTNAHSACYMLTQSQLSQAIASGGFLVPPHSGRYDMLCSVSTDPYTQCGFKRVLCVSHLQEFELHHLPNRYLNLCGLHENEFNLQKEAILEIQRGNIPTEQLFYTEKNLNTLAWDKSYYEACRHDVISLIPENAINILSVGCGQGNTEILLKERGKQVVVIPIDSIIATLPISVGLDVLPANFLESLEKLEGFRFDAIILCEILQHLADPVDMLVKLRKVLNTKGIIVGSVPNLSLSKRLLGKLFAKSKRFGSKFIQIEGDYDKTKLNLTNVPMLNNWFKSSDFSPVSIKYMDSISLYYFSKLVPFLPKSMVTRNILFVAQVNNN